MHYCRKHFSNAGHNWEMNHMTFFIRDRANTLWFIPGFEIVFYCFPGEEIQKPQQGKKLFWMI